MKTLISLLTGAALVLSFSSLARADLLGAEVLIEQNTSFSGTLRSDLVTVVAGVPEIDCPGPFDLCTANIPGGSGGKIDIEATSLTLNVGPAFGSSTFIVATFNGYIFSSLDAGAPITGVSLLTDIEGLDLSRVSFTSDSVAVNLSGLVVDPNEFFSVELEFGFSLVGDLVLIEQNTTTSGTLRSDLVTVVANVPEIDCPGAFDLCTANIPGGSGGEIDIEATSLTLNVGPATGASTFIVDTFNGYIFSGLDAGAPIVSVSLQTDIEGLDASRVSFTSDSVAVNLSGLVVDPNEFFTVTVPEPSLGLQMCSGLLLLAFIQSHARQRSS